jgi:DNA ligase-1
MTRWFEAHTVRQLGRFRQVHPVVVVEVAFDVIQRFNRHQSGFALRFPRIIRLRIDKSPTEIDILATVERLHRELQYGAEYLVTARVRASAVGPAETA